MLTAKRKLTGNASDQDFADSIKTENNGSNKNTRKSEISDNRQRFEDRILHFDGRLVFLPPPDRSRQFGEIHVRRHRQHGNELLLPEAATLSAGACRTISGAPTLRAMFAKMKAHTHARAQKAPAAPARGEITLSRGERSPLCLFPSRKLKSGILGGPKTPKNKRKRLTTKTIQRLNLISTSA